MSRAVAAALLWFCHVLPIGPMAPGDLAANTLRYCSRGASAHRIAQGP